MTVSDVMQAEVLTVNPNAPAATARRQMRAHQVHHLVVQQGTTLVGIVSAKDLARTGRRANLPKKLLVSEFMLVPVVTASPRTRASRRQPDARTLYRLPGRGRGRHSRRNRDRLRSAPAGRREASPSPRQTNTFRPEPSGAAPQTTPFRSGVVSACGDALRACNGAAGR
jgi:hypothetical protein